MTEAKKEDKLNKFSVPLGLLDYVNPILYSITMITIIHNIASQLASPYNILLNIGAAVSVFFGLVIPTGKVIVGLGIIQFVMPVSLVLAVNSGILLTGFMLLKYVFDIHYLILLIMAIVIIVLLYKTYQKKHKLNSIAVLTGAVGYLMIYISLITLAIRKSLILPIVLYGLAILLFVLLVAIGINSNLKKPKVHWMIEISNVLCQLFVALATLYLFKI